MTKIKTAVVGVGALGRHHLRWYSKLENSELVGLFDTDREKAEQYAKEYNVRAFDSLESLAESVQAVSVVVPTTDHYDVGSLLIERGVHCLIEKPVTSDYEDARRLQTLSKEKGVKVSVGQIERFNPAVRALAEIDIRPSFIEAHRLAAFDPRGTDVAVVLDLMIHDIDLCLMFIRRPVVSIEASAVAVVSQQPDIANARLTFDNGAVANLTASRISLHAMRKLRIFQKSGYYSLDLAGKQADLYRLAKPGQKLPGMRVPLGKSGQDLLYSKQADDGKDMLALELRTFLNELLNDSPVAVPVEDGMEALRIALEVDRIGRETSQRMLEMEST